MNWFYAFGSIYNNLYSVSPQSNTWEMIYMYNYIIENTNSDCRVHGSGPTLCDVHAQESTVLKKYVISGFYAYQMVLSWAYIDVIMDFYYTF